VFDGLLPELYNTDILQLLFVCAHWHGLVKMRMHTESTLDILNQTTHEIGNEFRKFAGRTCTAFNTRELAREVAARKHRRQKQAKTSALGDPTVHLISASSSQPTACTKDDGPRPKTFSLDTYIHALGDYVQTISQFGTTDSYSTEPVSIIYI
jgi:hypothetical protein